ncbi:hypothetical protein [Aquimarina intermedia]|uniref:Uncharacterized protein n=1 Tax=Aquimarina intermedia TaxID=350814 RepID=A0A5S5CA84_9FLAO|nr:hypothetical protein [Aquimarina intermedia]TYP76059.1 hypothetical protein BD809_102273 [Aquimarina intermedia]
MENISNIKPIKSVRVTLVSNSHRRLLLQNAGVLRLEDFLSDSIDDEVIIISTNFGLEIYYYTTVDYFDFISEAVKFYCLKKTNIDDLRFENNNEEHLVYQAFCDALLTFSQYPQIFLAYSKKFVRIKELHSNSKYIIPILDRYFEDVLKYLELNRVLPHSDKLMKIRQKKSQESDSYHVIKALILEILSKKHSN